jgi:hypothetical protein
MYAFMVVSGHAEYVGMQRAHMELIARNEYMAGDNRDPTACSLFYFALGKVKLVHGLWKQAAWHKEQAVMLKFLANDFTQPQRKTAALKNAYALLSKQRFGKPPYPCVDPVTSISTLRIRCCVLLVGRQFERRRQCLPKEAVRFSACDCSCSCGGRRLGWPCAA